MRMSNDTIGGMSKVPVIINVIMYAVAVQRTSHDFSMDATVSYSRSIIQALRKPMACETITFHYSATNISDKLPRSYCYLICLPRHIAKCEEWQI